MIKNDIIINDEKNEFKFNYRVAGVFVNDNKVLLQKCDRDDYYSLVGGRVQYGETTKDALKREIKEEIGIIINYEELQLISVVENFFRYKNKNIHELLFIYQINNDEIKKLNDIKVLDKDDVIDKWYDISKLKSMDVRPNIIIDSINNKHIVHNIIK